MIKAIIFDLGNTLMDQDTKELYPFAIETLENLGKKFKLGLITNTMTSTKYDEIVEYLKSVKIYHYFEHVIVSGELGYHKPTMKIFDDMCEKLNVNPNECIMIGNTISTDIFGGNRIGMETVLIQPEEGYRKSSWEYPDHTITSLKELVDIAEK